MKPKFKPVQSNGQMYVYARLFFFRWLYSPLGPWRLIFSFVIILQTVGLLGRVISLSQGLYVNTGQHTE
jgi:hypothetical protein